MDCDVLIIGSGIAGCAAALHLADAGLNVRVLTKASNPHVSNTYYAQGGIIGQCDGDTPKCLEADIVAAGAGLCNPTAVRQLAEKGPSLTREFLLLKMGVPFTEKAGKPDCTAEAAHSLRRIYHCDDITGRRIEISLLQALEVHPKIELRTSTMAVDLITNTHHSTDLLERYRVIRCFGAYALNMNTGEVERILATNTILATGGIGAVYLHTTNPGGATGDGIAMAYRAGIPIINSEFVQFHPTTLYLADSNERFLISESVRGEGAVLVDRQGKAFMKDFHMAGDLAPRDVVARAIFTKMLNEDASSMYLDLSGVAKDMSFESRFPNITRSCRERGIRVPDDTIPVVPAAHYFCGGIKTDTDGSTAVPGLYAIGECACTGLHGANRLASTSLLEGLVWGVEAARRIAEKSETVPVECTRSIPEWDMPDGAMADPILIQNDVRQLQTTMWNYVGIIRNQSRLNRAKQDLSQLFISIDSFYRQNRISGSLLELRNMITVARIVVFAAGRNSRSVGCHFLESGLKPDSRK
ncbi:MAG: L-aspartate oxidase [Acidobacteria bacterium]|nr:L-aspartate oxidase [Acidobacteriota bacterium]